MDYFTAFMHAFNRWEWWAISGVVMAILEMLIPGAIFLWPGLAALTVSLVITLIHTGWQFNLLLFSVLSVTYAWWGRSAYMNKFAKTDHPQLNQRANQLIGKHCILIEKTTIESGRAKIGDTAWLARTKDENLTLQAGTLVTIHAVEGTTLIVLPVVTDQQD
jgi:membrane protein implicated in regulation of membrane protease activity